MSNKEKIGKWLKEHDGEDYCYYCLYKDGCNKMTGGPDGLIEPACTNGEAEELLDLDAILEDIEELEEKEAN